MEDLPKMERGVTSPGSPGGGADDHFLFTRQRCSWRHDRFPDTKVARWKSIGETEGAHGDILGSPFANAANFTQRGDDIFDRSHRAKSQFTTFGGDCEIAQGGRACAWQADRRNVFGFRFCESASR